jgi:hypothetical protein
MVSATIGTIRGVSSVGRALALQAGGHRFDPDTLHQVRGSRSAFAQERHSLRTFSSDGNQIRAEAIRTEQRGNCPRVFDIVNGFLIDAVAHGSRSLRSAAMRHLQM